MYHCVCHYVQSSWLVTLQYHFCSITFQLVHSHVYAYVTLFVTATRIIIGLLIPPLSKIHRLIQWKLFQLRWFGAQPVLLPIGFYNHHFILHTEISMFGSAGVKLNGVSHNLTRHLWKSSNGYSLYHHFSSWVDVHMLGSATMKAGLLVLS